MTTLLRRVGYLFTVVALCIVSVAGIATAEVDPFVIEAAAPAEELSLTMIKQTSIVADLRTFSIEASLNAASGLDRDQYEIAFTVYQRIRDRAAFKDSITGTRLGSAIYITRTPIDVPDRVGQVPINFEATIGTCSACIPLSVDGVYPVVVDVRRRGDGGVVTQIITNLILLTRSDQPVLSVALLLPIHMRADSLVKADADGLRQLITVTESLASRPGFPASVSLTPSVTDFAAKNTTINGTLDALSASLDGREIIAGPYNDLRPEIEGDPRLVDVVAGQLRRGEQRLSDRFPNQVTGSTGVYFDSDALPKNGFNTLGLQRLVIAESLLAVTGDPTFDQPIFFDPGDIATPQTASSGTETNDTSSSIAIASVVADGDLAAHLEAANDPILGIHQLMADLSIIATEGGQNRGVVVELPVAGLSRATIDSLFDLIAQQPQLRPVQVSALFDLPTASAGDDQFAFVTPRSDSPETLTSDDIVTKIDKARRFIDGVSVTFGDDSGLIEAAEQAFSVGLSIPQQESIAYLNDAFTKASDLLAQVKLGDAGPFRLTALEGKIPLSVINQTGQLATVMAVLRSNRVVTEEGGRFEIAAEAASPEDGAKGRITVIPIGVSTRSSGTFGVAVGLETLNGVPLDQAEIVIASTGVSGLGLAITVALLGLLLLWWVRTRRATVKARRTTANLTNTANLTDDASSSQINQ